MSHLLTAILKELKTSYVTQQTAQDKKMRSRINQTITLVNGYSEISNLVIKGNPFDSNKRHIVKEGSSSSNQ
jgi:hypothetical protein